MLLFLSVLSLIRNGAKIHQCRWKKLKHLRKLMQFKGTHLLSSLHIMQSCMHVIVIYACLHLISESTSHARCIELAWCIIKVASRNGRGGKHLIFSTVPWASCCNHRRTGKCRANINWAERGRFVWEPLPFADDASSDHYHAKGWRRHTTLLHTQCLLNRAVRTWMAWWSQIAANLQRGVITIGADPLMED